MLSLDYIRRKIRSIETTSKITNAMYLVATASMNKCFKQFNESQIFFSEFYEVVSDLFDEKANLHFDLFKPGAPVYYVAIGSDVGLCGSYNANVFKVLKNNLQPNDKVLLIGKKGLYLFKTNNLFNYIDDAISFPTGGINIYFTMYIAEKVFKQIKQRYSKIVLVYTKYRNALLFEPSILQVLPFEKSLFVKKKLHHDLPEYEPSKAEILKNIVPMVFSIFLYGALSESLLCENSSRRNSMREATKNAENLIKKYKLVYNKVRQSKITQEIIEVVTGSSANASE